MPLNESKLKKCGECDEEYDEELDNFAKGPNGYCSKCRMEKYNQQSITRVHINGERWYGRLDTDLRNEIEWHGQRGAIAAQGFRVYPSVKQVTVSFKGIQRTFHRGDFEDPGSGIELNKKPTYPPWREKREENLNNLE